VFVLANVSVVGVRVTVDALVVVVVVVVGVTGVDLPPHATSTRARESTIPASCPTRIWRTIDSLQGTW
jgi:hypothetical protein